MAANIRIPVSIGLSYRGANAGMVRLRADEGFTAATELANRLVMETGMSFRRAHHRVGELVTEAAARGEPLAGAAGALFREEGIDADAAGVDPAAVANGAAYGGGPAEGALRRAVAELRREWSAAARRLHACRERWREGDRALDAATAGVLAGEALPDDAPAEPMVATATEPATAG